MQRISLYSLLVSLFIHILVLSEISDVGFRACKLSLPQKNIVLRFVEVPKDVEEEKVKRKVDTVAVKDVSAKDKSMQSEKKGKVRAKNISDIKQLGRISGREKGLISENHKKIDSRIAGRNIEKRDDTRLVQLTPSLSQGNPPSRDILSFPEITDSIFSSPEFSELRFEASSSIVAPYIKEVKDRIQEYWLSYLLFKYPDVFLGPSETVIWFRILKDGSIEGPKVIRYKGNRMFKDICLASIENVVPFPVIPEDIWKEVKKGGGIEIVFTFRYR